MHALVNLICYTAGPEQGTQAMMHENASLPRGNVLYEAAPRAILGALALPTVLCYFFRHHRRPAQLSSSRSQVHVCLRALFLCLCLSVCLDPETPSPHKAASICRFQGTLIETHTCDTYHL